MEFRRVLFRSEHVIAEEVEEALMSVATGEGVGVIEFTVAPQVQPAAGELPYHEWFVEFETPPAEMERFRLQVDEALQQRNVYRSEEHTSELQSLMRISYAVFCLKKKKTNKH